MRIRALLIPALAGLTFAGLAVVGAAQAGPPSAPAPGVNQPLVITADNVRQAHGVATWTGHVTVSGIVDPAHTEVTLDGRAAPSLDLATLPPLAAAKLTNRGKGRPRARLDLVSQR
jgi:hypothetical protein